MFNPNYPRNFLNQINFARVNGSRETTAMSQPPPSCAQTQSRKDLVDPRPQAPEPQAKPSLDPNEAAHGRLESNPATKRRNPSLHPGPDRQCRALRPGNLRQQNSRTLRSTKHSRHIHSAFKPVTRITRTTRADAMCAGSLQPQTRRSRATRVLLFPSPQVASSAHYSRDRHRPGFIRNHDIPRAKLVGTTVQRQQRFAVLRIPDPKRALHLVR